MKKTITIFFLFWIVLIYPASATEFVIGRIDKQGETLEASQLVCLGFEADHPKNKCKDELINFESIIDDLAANRIQLAIIPEELMVRHKNLDKVVTILPLYQQYFMMITKGDFSFDQVKRLENKKIMVFEGITAQYHATPFLKSMKVDPKKVKFYQVTDPRIMVDQFCHYGIDAVLLMISKSNAVPRELTTACDGRIVSLPQARLDQFLKQNISFSTATLPAKMYWRVTDDIHTFSSRTVLVANKNPSVLTFLARSMDHIMEELMMSNMRQLITPQDLIDAYALKAMKLHPMGMQFMNILTEKTSIKTAGENRETVEENLLKEILQVPAQ